MDRRVSDNDERTALMRFHSILPVGVLLCALGATLAGCGGSNDTSVVTRDPLAVPPDVDARPPRVGNGSQDLASVQPNWQTVFRAGTSQQGTAPGSKAAGDPGTAELLRLAGAQDAPPDIRSEIANAPESGSAFASLFVDKLLAWQPPGSTGAKPPAPGAASGGKDSAAGTPRFEVAKSHSWFGWLF
jgi:Protein of unknown function (DUF3035)